jgi:2-keto-3-deoxy-L-rhamnonate aldolase RhmA
MVPHGSTVVEAKAVVESCRYPPLGHRSAAGSGPALGYAARSQAAINTHLNEHTLLSAMLETPEAIENANAVAAVDGIDVVHIGSNRPQRRNGHPRPVPACPDAGGLGNTAKAARSHRKSFGAGGVRQDLEFQTWLLQIGMRYLTGGADVGYILNGGRVDVKRIRAVPFTSG